MSSRSMTALAACVVVAGLLFSLAGAPGAGASSPQPSAASPVATVYSQPPGAGGVLYQSSRNGTDNDRYVWDDFAIPAGQSATITEVQWRGGYDPTKFGSGGPVLDFRVAIYPSIAGGSQPDVVGGPVVTYLVGGSAGETLAGTFGGVPMYDYHFTLPAPFVVSQPVRYWAHIEALQGGMPDWGMSAGTGGNGTHFLGMALAGDISYYVVPGDTAFTLLGAVTAGPKVYLPSIFRS